MAEARGTHLDHNASISWSRLHISAERLDRTTKSPTPTKHSQVNETVPAHHNLRCKLNGMLGLTCCPTLIRLQRPSIETPTPDRVHRQAPDYVKTYLHIFSSPLHHLPFIGRQSIPLKCG
ncbi:hypothetical protein Pst134EA_024334 [Puccinia striiformis f. sp. tritici]|uniref:hypothetical protein n=1 Tax=Puccinia striiformis f. sp. tritici TaxID=168172 RepID=UPI002007756E|nr:hypothetical protein Pst134EA_024334 [Puccinia striiformis f. sp. tritici]KAH9453459.1 hypothetical protein Pst134EA_024334 [Puccinia striiformis f. sp. tritici]